MSLLDAVNNAPEPKGSCWTKYRREFFILLDEKGYKPKQAADFISEYVGHSTVEAKKFYSAAKDWIFTRNKGGKAA